MAITKTFIDIELSDGTAVEDARVFWADKVAAERTMTAKGMGLEDHSMMMTGLIAWNVAKRTGATQLGWEEFQAAVVDAMLHHTDPNAATEADPTEAA